MEVRADDRRSTRTVGKSLLVIALGALSVTSANAQVMPGMRAATDMVDGAVMTVISGCFLASAHRPVPGINRPANGNAGEGITEQRSAPDWVKKASTSKGRSRFATLATPEGEIWIRFDEATSRCSVIVRPTDVPKFRAAFGDSLATGGTTRLKRESAPDGSETIVNEDPAFVYTSRVSVPEKTPDVVLIENTFRPPRPSTPDAAPPPVRALVEPKTFVDSVRAGQLDAESYDFDGAGFFRLTPAQRSQWQAGLFGALGLADGSGPPACTITAQRNGSALTWAQIAVQSSDSDEWKTTVRTMRARLAELDQLLKRSAPNTPSADPLVQELLVRFARDQDVRSVFSQKKWSEGLTPAQANNWLGAASNRMEAIDCDNTAWLKSQLAKIGWFTIPRYGTDADTAAWHLVQHADLEPSFRQEMLVKLQALPAGQTDGKRLGYLFDRVARADGRLQRYGTQGQCKDGEWTPFESEDPANLDRRRASLGMETISELLKKNSRDNCLH